MLPHLPAGRVVIIRSRYHETITGALLTGALTELREQGVAESQIDVIEVPGAFELPVAAARVAKRLSVEVLSRSEQLSEERLRISISSVNPVPTDCHASLKAQGNPLRSASSPPIRSSKLSNVPEDVLATKVKKQHAPHSNYFPL